MRSLQSDNTLIFSLLAAAGFVAGTLLLVRPLWDIDLWWHLATGRELWQQSAFLNDNPFAYPGFERPDPNREFLLNSYWIFQLVLYACNQLFGYTGLIVLRLGILLSGPVVMYFWMRRNQVAVHFALPLTLLCLWLFHYFSGLRPASASFAFFPILVILLNATGFRRNDASERIYRWSYAAAIIFLMLLWANTHPGFLIGSAVLVIYLVGEGGALFFSPSKVSCKSFLVVTVLLLLAIGATVVNPNGILPYYELIQFEGSELQSRTSEYTSPLTLLLKSQAGAWPYWIMVVVGSGLFLYRWRLAGLTRLAMVLFLLLVSLTAQRYQPFLNTGMMALLLPVILAMNDSGRWRKPGLVFSVFICISLCITAVFYFEKGWGRTMDSPLKTGRVPEKAFSFVTSHKPRGQLMAHFNWGGYQAWVLGDDYPAFIDGRSLNSKLFEDYTHLLWTKQAKPYLLDKYNINTIVTPRLKPFNGELYQLTNYLSNDHQWSLVYSDQTAMVLVRGKGNAKLAAEYGMNKRLIWESVLADARGNLEDGDDPVYAYQAMFQAYGALGQTSDAERALRQLKEFGNRQ